MTPSAVRVEQNKLATWAVGEVEEVEEVEEEVERMEGMEGVEGVQGGGWPLASFASPESACAPTRASLGRRVPSSPPMGFLVAKADGCKCE